MAGQTNKLTTLLSTLGWGSGFRLPVSNDENRELEKLLEQAQKDVLDLRGEIGEQAKVRDNLNQHLERVETEIRISRKLLDSKLSSFETEQNILALEEKQAQYTQKEINETNDVISDLEFRNDLMRRQIISRRKSVIENQEKLMNAHDIEAFKAALEAKEQDMSYILQLSNVDEKLVEDFEMKFQKYGEMLQIAKNELDYTVKYTHTLDSQYERVCMEYRRSHKERLEAIDLWKKSLDTLTKRDLEIRSLAHEYSRMLKLCRQVSNSITKKQEVLKEREENTKKVEHQLFRLDRQLAEHRIILNKLYDTRHSLTDEVLDARTIIANKNDHIRDVRQQMIQFDEENESMDNKMRLAEAELHVTKDRYNHEFSRVQSIESRLKELERMVIDEEQKEDDLMKEIERMRKFHFQKGNEVITLRTKCADIDFDIKSRNIMYKNLRERSKTDFIEVQKKKHAAYEMELHVLAAETKYNELAYPTVAEDTSSLYYNAETLTEVREELESLQKDKLLVSHQKSHLEDLVRRFVIDIEKEIIGKKKLEEEATDTRIKKTLIETALNRKMNELREIEVEQVLIKLELRKFLIADKEQKERIVSFEQHRLYLQMAAKERKTEIDEHKSLLRMKLNMIRDEKSKRIFQRNDILKEIERRKKRYEILMDSLASQEDREKEEFSEALFILKNAQEREAIKREGDLWDQRVKETEKEVVALQNTLALMTGSNKAFKDSLAPIQGSTETGEQIRQLEQAQREAVVRKRKAEKLQRELAKHCAEKESEIFNLTQTIEMLASLAEDKKYELNAVMVEIASQKAKIDRANKVATRLARDLGTQSDEEKKLIEAELQLKCAREKFGFALKTLDRALSFQPNMIHTVIEYLKQNPLLTDIAKRLTHFGTCTTDSVPASGTVTPKSSSTARNTSKCGIVGTLYDRKSKFSISSGNRSGTPSSTRSSHSASKVGSPAAVSSSRAGSSISRQSAHEINTQQLKMKLHHLKREEILFPGAD